MSLIYPITDYPVAAPDVDEYVAPATCQHRRSEIRRFVISNGSVRFCPECQNCFARNVHRMYGRKRAATEFGLTEAELDQLPDVNDRARRDWCNRRSDMFDARRQYRRRSWWQWYNSYLASPEWYARRLAVLKRDGNRCRASSAGRTCNANASQVHHLTYERVGREPLDDLVAVCDECHEKLHARVAP